MRSTSHPKRVLLLALMATLPATVVALAFVWVGDYSSKVQWTVTRVVANISNTTTTSDPFELRNDTTRGFVLGAGLDVKVLLIHIAPEVRFTRWGAKHFVDPNGLLNSKQNQAEFLVGITF